MLKGESRRSGVPVITDFRGSNRRKAEKAQTLLSPFQVSELVAAHAAGTPVKVLYTDTNVVKTV